MAIPANYTERSNVLLWHKEGQEPCVHVGSYPTKTDVDVLLLKGINVFINLCTEEEIEMQGDYTEQIRSSGLKVTIINLHTPFKKAPSKEVIERLVKDLAVMIEKGAKIYIHSLNGNGRANTLACHLYTEVTKCNNPNTVLCIILERYATRVETINAKAVESRHQYSSILGVEQPIRKRRNRQRIS